MGDYFHGWRRKTGVLTLVMACLFMGGWIRSTIICEEFNFATSATSGQIIASVDRHLAWLNFIDVRSQVLPEFPKWSIEPFMTFDEWLNNGSKTWKWRFCGFAAGKGVGPMNVTIFVVPYWALTAPLTIISFWLLLSKPRKSTQKEINEPIPADGM